MASDMISVDRNLSDMRSEACQRLSYDTAQMPRTSIIIVFHNEAWSTLLRTVHSVINTSPRHLVQEIILGIQQAAFESNKKLKITSQRMPSVVVADFYFI
jgi:hypothetical protein